MACVWADICHMSAPQSYVQVVTVVTVAPEGGSALASVAGHVHRSALAPHSWGRGKRLVAAGQGRAASRLVVLVLGGVCVGWARSADRLVLPVKVPASLGGGGMGSEGTVDGGGAGAWCRPPGLGGPSVVPEGARHGGAGRHMGRGRCVGHRVGRGCCAGHPVGPPARPVGPAGRPEVRGSGAGREGRGRGAGRLGGVQV